MPPPSVLRRFGEGPGFLSHVPSLRARKVRAPRGRPESRKTKKAQCAGFREASWLVLVFAKRLSAFN